MSSDAPAIPLFGDAYMADTMHLTLEEHGAYLRLLMLAWRTPDCSLPNDDARIARMLGISGQRWRKIRPAVMDFWTLEDGRWSQKRLKKEREYVASKKKSQSKNAAVKWGSSGNSREHAMTRSQRLAAAREKGKHTNAEWAELLELTGHRCVKCLATGNLVKDHITPIYQGGSDAISNLQPLCIRCNSSKTSDSTDYRLSVCKDLYERLPNASRTSAPPPPPTYIPSSKEEGRDASQSDKVFWANAKSYIGGKNPGALIGKWCRDYTKAEVAKAIGAAQVERAVDPVSYIERILRGASKALERPIA